MINANPTDDDIINADDVMLMDSRRKFYQSIGARSVISRSPSGEPTKPVNHLTIAVDAADVATLEEWRKRINRLRGSALAE